MKRVLIVLGVALFAVAFIIVLANGFRESEERRFWECMEGHGFSSPIVLDDAEDAAYDAAEESCS